ncbi:histidine phosphatase family protein [Alkalibacillus aidingensis]|uniref:histidine phosphatase family protein n=1 Tax=Alkalibacillus aidingensis TaxID=2747607 RepID=UPI0016610BBA|nr:histidine phosphatase family protein [Alkalibacillus aidingensis]
MEILVVRHGQSTADLEDRHEGRADFPLTELGLDQARNAATWINQHYKPSKIITSPLNRALQTADIISKSTGVMLEKDEDLMEWNNGWLAGLLRSEALEKYPMPEGGRKPHDEHYGCESMIQFRARAERFWSRLIYSDTAKTGERICVVSHGGLISMLYRSFLNLPVETDVTLMTGDTGIHLWDYTSKRKRIKFSNSQEHLANLTS